MRLPLLIFVMLLTPFCADANDSAARVGAGGLELLKTNDIEMISEVLELSTSKVKVTYHFLNKSPHDITTTVAFPMPAFGYASHDENQRPLDSFRMFVDGKEVAVHKNRVFLLNDVDITDKLREIGLSDDKIFEQDWCLSGYPDSELSTPCSLTEKQALELKNMQAWKGQIKETAYWEQTFPAGKELEIVHEYTPFTGVSHSEGIPEKEACMDERTRKRIEREFADNAGGTRLDVEYILGTGRNWRGPIKHFKLILRKDEPDQTVSLCFPGKPIKTGPTTIEFSHSDFVPQDKLVVYFLVPHY